MCHISSHISLLLLFSLFFFFFLLLISQLNVILSLAFPLLLSFHLPTTIYLNITFPQSFYLPLSLAFLIPPLTISLQFSISFYTFPTHIRLFLSLSKKKKNFGQFFLFFFFSQLNVILSPTFWWNFLFIIFLAFLLKVDKFLYYLKLYFELT